MAASVRTWGICGAVAGGLIAVLGILSFGPALAFGGVFQTILVITLGPFYPLLMLLSFLGFPPIGYWPPGVRLVFLLAILALYVWLGYTIARSIARRRTG